MAAEGATRVKSFVSENELEEKRKVRQTEWEKVRQPDQPLECPEEEYDHKSLYDRLQEQKEKKQAEYEEQHRLKNMIRGLDDEEVQFLDLVDQTKAELENQRWKEEIAEIKEYRQAVASLAENVSKHITEKKKPQQNANNSKKSQQALLAGAVKRKSFESAESTEKKRKCSDSESYDNSLPDVSNNLDDSKSNNDSSSQEDSFSSTKSSECISPSAKCIAILPGLGAYTDSSDSNTSSSEIEEDTGFDLLGRRKALKCEDFNIQLYK